MKGRTIATVAAVCCAMLAAPSAATALKDGTYKTKLTLEYRNVGFADSVFWSGRVKSKAYLCGAARRPTLYQKVPGNDERIGKSTPFIGPHPGDVWGDVRVDFADISAGDKFYAKIGKKKGRGNKSGIKCKPDKSKTVTYQG